MDSKVLMQTSHVCTGTVKYEEDMDREKPNSDRLVECDPLLVPVLDPFVAVSLKKPFVGHIPLPCTIAKCIIPYICLNACLMWLDTGPDRAVPGAIHKNSAKRGLNIYCG